MSGDENPAHMDRFIISPELWFGKTIVNWVSAEVINTYHIFWPPFSTMTGFSVTSGDSYDKPFPEFKITDYREI